jgi:hypothetical protein
MLKYTVQPSEGTYTIKEKIMGAASTLTKTFTKDINQMSEYDKAWHKLKIDKVVEAIKNGADSKTTYWLSGHNTNSGLYVNGVLTPGNVDELSIDRLRDYFTGDK